MPQIIIPFIVLGWLGSFAKHCKNTMKKIADLEIDPDGWSVEIGTRNTIYNLCRSLCMMGIQSHEVEPEHDDDWEIFLHIHRDYYIKLISNILMRYLDKETLKKMYNIFMADKLAKRNCEYCLLITPMGVKYGRGCNESVLCCDSDYAHLLQIMCGKLVIKKTQAERENVA